MVLGRGACARAGDGGGGALDGRGQPARAAHFSGEYGRVHLLLLLLLLLLGPEMAVGLGGESIVGARHRRVRP